MCWVSDAIGPMYEYLINPKWKLRTTKPKSTNPPSPDDLLALETTETVFFTDAWDDPEPAQATRPKAATGLELKDSSGMIPP